ncbi:winged helix-turn-helix transcriptional regulator [Candidatus Fermentibacteria bacterium]|nr:winged helix-turn-helix transcriptional regulator [Candidatus Fermentibacteria bacterium]
MKPVRDDEKDVLRVLQALGSESRLRIVRLLAGGGSLCVGALAGRLEVTQSAASQHLRILEEAGLVRSERRGMKIHYSLVRPALDESMAKLSASLRPDQEAGDDEQECRGRRRSCADAKEDAGSPRT